MVGSVAIEVARNQRQCRESSPLGRHSVESSPFGRHRELAPVFSLFVQHGNISLLHAAIWSQADWFKGAEEYQGDIQALSRIVHPTSGLQGALEEEKRSSVPNITPACDIKRLRPQNG